ncbi:MAG TPA: heparinase II/III family protein [Bacteroidota bacterium]
MDQYPWYRKIFETNKAAVDRFLPHGPVYVSPVKQTYQYQMYTCPKHNVELLYEEFRPHEHRCPRDTMEIFRGAKYDAAWSGWYNRRLATHLVWMGLLWQTSGDERYARAGRELLLKFAELYLKYPTANTILGPAHVFFGTLSESFWGVDMAYGYDLLYDYRGFSAVDRNKIKEKLFYPLALITQQFPESASNRQLWYNNVSAAVGFLYGDRRLIDFALEGKYGFSWQLGSALPESGFWPEWSGYHFVTLRAMIHLAEMGRHNGLDLYHRVVAGRSMKKMFDAPFAVILPNLEFPRSKDSGGGRITEYATFYEIGYAVYRDSTYLALLNLTNMQRGKQVVGEESGLHETENPITLFNLVPELPAYRAPVYPAQSMNLEGTGFAVLREGTGEDRTFLYLDYGIMGGEHGHPDRLQIGYYADGRNWIVDPLNEAYFNPNLQLWYRQSIAHNTVVLDQTSQTWTNGRYRFFGALPDFQVSSGASETMYPGAALTRTVLQAGDYFIDLFDIRAHEPRTIDWPLHGFGELSITGVALHAEPPDRFGKQPGIPGYDQLTEIRSGLTDSAWAGTFEDIDGKHMLVRAAGEKGTQLFTMRTPRLGGFYKQMVTDSSRMPMLMSRRVARATRFAHLVHAYGSRPTVLGFEAAADRGAYRILRAGGEEILHADTDSLRFWWIRLAGGRPEQVRAFNTERVVSGGLEILSAPIRLESVSCRWNQDSLLVESPSGFGFLRVYAPAARVVAVNGHPTEFMRSWDKVVFRDSRQGAVEVITTSNDTLFLGMRNVVNLRLPSVQSGKRDGPAPKIRLPSDWDERLESQLRWWGGIVNLKATNKGPVTRPIYPDHYRKDPSWLTEAAVSSRGKGAGPGEVIQLAIDVPNDAPPVEYPVILHIGGDSVAVPFHVAPPVRAEVLLPNGPAQTLLIRLENLTGSTLVTEMTVSPERAWRMKGPGQYSLRLDPKADTAVRIPVELAAYSSANQLYPVKIALRSGSFSTEVVRDLYAVVAHRASSSPSLDGSWHGWDTARPATIDRQSQVCRLLLGNQPWRGKQDLSARVFVMYDESSLYVGAAVTDDSLVTHWNFPVMSYPWDTDCMEVVLDTRTGSDQGSDPPTPGLFRHLSLAEYRYTDFPPELWQGGGAGGPLLPKPLLVPGAETFFTRSGSGYAMICRYPAASLRGLRLLPGTKIGFDVAISDNDGTSYRKNQHIWAGFTQNQSWWDMGTIGILLLQ